MVRPLFSTMIHLCIAVLYLLGSASVSSGIGEVCILGSTEVTETSFLNSGGQYLDFGHPAPCTGKLTAWHFCYYAADISLTSSGQVQDYVVEFRVWRTVDGNSFNRIHVDRITMAIAPPSDGQTLICENATLSTPLDVLTGDMLGVYIFITSGMGQAAPLHIIAHNTSDFGLRFDTRDNNDAFNSETVSINDLESRPTLGLHLYADIVIDCGGLDNPSNGQVTITPGLVAMTGEGAMATYTCSEGYSLNGSAARTCQADGQWDGTEPTCMLIDCGGLSDPENGQVTISSGPVAQTGVGATATYTCNISAGYMLVGTVMRTCQDSGQWSGMDPTCIRCDIASITDPGNGRVTITSPGGVITAVYTCDVGYTVVGVATRTCQSDGQFSGQEPVCQVIDCGGLANPSNGQVTITPGLIAMTGEGAMATYTCSEGYSLNGGSVRTCQADGQWDGAEPTCMLIDCGGLSDPENGQVTISPGLVAQTGVGATATYTCNTSAGYMLVGTVMRTCQDSGQWTGIVPTCIRCDIASVTDPGNGSVTITSPGGVITAVYTCDVGYTVVGVATRTCQPDGQFSGQEPVCQVIDCGGLSDPENGQVTVSPGPVAQTGVGATATYTCNTSAGYMLVGTVMRTCQDSGQWSGMVPTCIRCDIASVTDPGNGRVAITSPGGVITAVYTCDVGYTLEGVATHTCQSDGQFSGQGPVCQVVDTKNLGPIIGGAVAGFLVAALVTLGIILAIIFMRSRRRTTTDLSLEPKSMVSNRASDQAALTDFQHTNVNDDIETSGNVAYVSSDVDAIPASHNEAYGITNPAAITTTQNKAYGSLPPGGRKTDDDNYLINQLSYEEAEDQYDYVHH